MTGKIILDGVAFIILILGGFLLVGLILVGISNLIETLGLLKKALNKYLEKE